MKRELSREILKLGVPVRIKEIEDELEEMHLDFPEFFLGHTPPRILRPELKNGTKAAPPEADAEDDAGTSGNAWRKKQNHRHETAKWLDKIAAAPRKTVHADTLRKWGMDLRGVSSLVNAGHLSRKGDLFTRTSKIFTVDRTAKDKLAKQAQATTKKSKVKGKLGAYMKQRLLGQQRSHLLLQTIEKHEQGISLADLKKAMPDSKFVGSLGPLARRDYIHHDGKVYTRTAKPYDPDH